MNIAISIISAIIKSASESLVENKLTNELIEISIDEISKKGINKINDFINEGRTKIEYILSEDNMKSMDISEECISYIVLEIKELLLNIHITDELFRQSKYTSQNLRSFLWKEYVKNKKDYIEYESEIKKILHVVSDTLIELMRKSEGFAEDILIQINNTVDETRVEIEKELTILKDNFEKLDAYNQMILNILWRILKQNQEIKTIQTKSRTQEYAEKWDANMFLNNFDKRDEGGGVNVKLKDTYIDNHLPSYKWKKNKNISTDLKELLSEYIEYNKGNQMLLILGQPGIGKSTLITWIVANYADRIKDILVYQFASDLLDIDWNNPDILKEILEKLNLSYKDLNEKILIFDGFDEISIWKNDRRVVLNQLYSCLLKMKLDKSIFLIITCRENYIFSLDMLQCNYIILQPWNENQIESFCTIYMEKVHINISKETKEKIYVNKEILGIPLILYMTLALNISIDKEGSIVDVYDQIFSLKDGGIYERCIKNNRYADLHRIGKIKYQIHQITEKIAIWMFENNPDEGYIPKREYEMICNIIDKKNQDEDASKDFLIGNYFKLIKHCGGIETERLYFVHRSIYEYFVAEAIYSSIKRALELLTEKSQKEFMENMVCFLKQGKITYTIEEYMNYKINKLYNDLSISKKQRFQEWCDESLGLLMDKGMFYYLNSNTREYTINIVEKELRCFLNLIIILRGMLAFTCKKYFMKNVNRIDLEKYIKYCIIKFKMDVKCKKEDGNLNLSRMYLENIDLSGIDLSGINFSNCKLERANLNRTYLEKTNLQGADLRYINLQEARLKDTNLEGSDLRFAHLYNAILQSVNLTDANITKIYLNKAKFYNININKAKLDLVSMTYISLYKCSIRNMKSALIYIEQEDKYLKFDEYLNSEYNHFLDEV